MPLLYLVVVDTLIALVAFLGLGLAVIAGLRDRGIAIGDGGPGLLVAGAAAGTVCNSLIFVALALARADFTAPSTFALVLAAQITLAAVALWRPGARRRFMASLPEACGGPVAILAAPAAAIGVWAFFRYPHVWDSGQLLLTQMLLTGSPGPGPIPPMAGYSALIALPAALTPALPLVTSAAGFKPPLMLLALAVASMAATAFDLKGRTLAAAAYLALMLMSVFGVYGLATTGKDSIFGILFCVAFLITLSRADAAERGWDLAVMFAAASLMGIIAVPYAALAYALWLIFAGPRAFRTLLPMVLVNAPTLPLIVAGFAHKPVFAVYAASLLAGLLGAGIILLVRRSWPALDWSVPVPARAAVPAIFLGLTALLLPAAVEVPVWTHLDGTVDTMAMFPTDGKTNIVQLILAYDYQALTVGIGTCVALIIGFLPLGRDRPGLVAAAAMPFAALFVTLLHHRLGLTVLSPFNIWDLTKDVPLWLGGALFSLFAVLGVSLLASGSSAPMRSLAPVALVLGVAAFAYPRMDTSDLMRAAAYTDVGGSANPAMSIVSTHTWRRLRGQTIYVARGTPLEDDQLLFALPMYGGQALKLTVEPGSLALTGPTGFVVPHVMIPAIIDLAKQRSASLEVLATLPGESVFLMLKPGGRDIQIPSELLEAVPHGTVSFGEGTYPEESLGNGTRFRWLRQRTELDVVLPSARGACLTLSIFASGMKTAGDEVDVSGSSVVTEPLSVRDTDILRPKQIKVALAPGLSRQKVTITTRFPETQFPGDARGIAIGIHTPIAIAPHAECEPRPE